MTIATNNFNRFAVESQLSDFSLPCFSTAAISKNFEEQQSQLYQPGIISCFFIVVLLCLHRQRVLLGLSFYVLLVFFHKLSSFWTVEYFQKAQGPFIQNQCKIFRKTNILPPWYAHRGLSVKRQEIIVFRKICVPAKYETKSNYALLSCNLPILVWENLSLTSSLISLNLLVLFMLLNFEKRI